MVKSKKKMKKNIRIAIILLIVICIFCIALIIIINNAEKENSRKKAQEEYDKVMEEVEETFLSDKKVVPQNYNFLQRIYEGNVDCDELYNKIYKLIYEIIPETYANLNEMTSSEIKSYYNENTEEIENDLGLETDSEYLKFVEAICKIGNGTYESSEFDVENMDTEDEYTVVDLEINFSTGNVIFKTAIINEVEEGKSSIRFIVE